MNYETSKGDWSQIKNQIKAKYGKLSDDSIESLRGHMDQLSGKLQSAYGYSKEKADTESTNFASSLQAKVSELGQKVKSTMMPTAKGSSQGPSMEKKERKE